MVEMKVKYFLVLHFGIGFHFMSLEIYISTSALLITHFYNYIIVFIIKKIL